MSASLPERALFVKSFYLNEWNASAKGSLSVNALKAMVAKLKKKKNSFFEGSVRQRMKISSAGYNRRSCHGDCRQSTRLMFMFYVFQRAPLSAPFLKVKNAPSLLLKVENAPCPFLVVKNAPCPFSTNSRSRKWDSCGKS